MRNADITKALVGDQIPARQVAMQRIVELRLSGLGTIKIAQMLNAEGHVGRLGGSWHHPSVRRQLARLGLGTSSPGTVWVPTGQGPALELGSEWEGEFRGIPIKGRVEASGGGRALIRVAKGEET
jgi:hypothetical protein